MRWLQPQIYHLHDVVDLLPMRLHLHPSHQRAESVAPHTPHIVRAALSSPANPSGRIYLLCSTGWSSLVSRSSVETHQFILLGENRIDQPIHAPAPPFKKRRHMYTLCIAQWGVSTYIMQQQKRLSVQCTE
jgi:hypothetical protein